MTKILSNKSSVDLDYPICRPSLDLDFTQEVLDPRITFSRGSIGTRVNRNRLIETVSANTPRFDYDPVTGECKGLLIEESRENLLLQSNGFDTASWSKNSVTLIPGSITSPDGTTNAASIIENTVSTTHNLSRNSATFTAGSTLTASIFVKQGVGAARHLRIQVNSNSATNGFRAYFNLSTNTVALTSQGFGTGTAVENSASIINYGNGWYRLIVSGTVDPSATSAVFTGFMQNSPTASASYTGDGVSNLYIYGAQLEAGAFPTSYIPTSGSTVIRTAELATMTGTNFSSWYNQTEGTFFYNGTLPFITNDTNNRVPYGVSNGLNFANSMYVSKPSSSLSLNFSVVKNNVGQLQGNTAIINMTSSEFKIASSFADRNIYSSGNGGAINKPIRPFASIPTVDRLSLGKEPWNSGASNPIIGCIKRFTYYPRALKPNQLQYLTQ